MPRPETGIQKRALIRDDSVPAGQPGPLYIQCCNTRIDVPHPFSTAEVVECSVCRTVYDSAGWIVEEGIRGS